MSEEQGEVFELIVMPKHHVIKEYNTSGKKVVRVERVTR